MKIMTATNAKRAEASHYTYIFHSAPRTAFSPHECVPSGQQLDQSPAGLLRPGGKMLIDSACLFAVKVSIYQKKVLVLEQSTVVCPPFLRHTRPVPWSQANILRAAVAENKQESKDLSN